MHVQTFLQMKCGGLLCFFKLCGNIKYIIILQGSYKSKFMILKQCIFVERALPEEKNLSILCIQRHQTKMLELCLVPAPTISVNVIQGRQDLQT